MRLGSSQYQSIPGTTTITGERSDAFDDAQSFASCPSSSPSITSCGLRTEDNGIPDGSFSEHIYCVAQASKDADRVNAVAGCSSEAFTCQEYQTSSYSSDSAPVSVQCSGSADQILVSCTPFSPWMSFSGAYIGAYETDSSIDANSACTATGSNAKARAICCSYSDDEGYTALDCKTKWGDTATSWIGDWSPHSKSVCDAGYTLMGCSGSGDRDESITEYYINNDECIVEVVNYGSARAVATCCRRNKPPSEPPTQSPSSEPSRGSTSPTTTPSADPSNSPSQTTSQLPSNSPTVSPSGTPSSNPTSSPSKQPSLSPISTTSVETTKESEPGYTSQETEAVMEGRVDMKLLPIASTSSSSIKSASTASNSLYIDIVTVSLIGVVVLLCVLICCVCVVAYRRFSKTKSVDQALPSSQTVHYGNVDRGENLRIPKATPIALKESIDSNSVNDPRIMPYETPRVDEEAADVSPSGIPTQGTEHAEEVGEADCKDGEATMEMSLYSGDCATSFDDPAMDEVVIGNDDDTRR